MRPTRIRLLGVVCVFVGAACGGSAPPEGIDSAAPSGPAATITVTVDSGPTVSSSPSADEARVPLVATSARVDLGATGNRWIDGAGSFTSTEPTVFSLGDGRPRWILPAGLDRWIVFLDDGSTVDLTSDDDRPGASPGLPPGSVDVDTAPPLLADGVPVEQVDLLGPFDDPLPDTRTVSDGESTFALGGPSDRYAHGVLGDSIEPTTIEVATADGEAATVVALAEPDVFEAVSPMLADLDADGRLELVLTVANAATGARIVAYESNGDVYAETPPIGRGNRWRNLLAVAPVGPNGETELIDVQTPHIGGILQFFRDDGTGGLDLVASTQTYSTHSIGSRNLDLGIVTDADGNGSLDVLLPTQDQRALAVVTRDDTADGGTRELFRIDLGARVVTNVAATDLSGTVGYAVGLDDGRVLVWPAST